MPAEAIWTKGLKTKLGDNLEESQFVCNLWITEAGDCE
jgi:hypothetical protein